MSALMRKELLDKAGGFEAFGCYLAEDFFFAKCITVNIFFSLSEISLSTHHRLAMTNVPLLLFLHYIWSIL